MSFVVFTETHCTLTLRLAFVLFILFCVSATLFDRGVDPLKPNRFGFPTILFVSFLVRGSRGVPVKIRQFNCWLKHRTEWKQSIQSLLSFYKLKHQQNRIKSIQQLISLLNKTQNTMETRAFSLCSNCCMTKISNRLEKGTINLLFHC